MGWTTRLSLKHRLMATLTIGVALAMALSALAILILLPGPLTTHYQTLSSESVSRFAYRVASFQQQQMDHLEALHQLGIVSGIDPMMRALGRLPMYERHLILDSTGRVIESTDPLLAGYDFQGRDVFLRAQQTTDPFYLVYYSGLLNKVVLLIVVPVYVHGELSFVGLHYLHPGAVASEFSLELGSLDGEILLTNQAGLVFLQIGADQPRRSVSSPTYLYSYGLDVEALTGYAGVFMQPGPPQRLVTYQQVDWLDAIVVNRLALDVITRLSSTATRILLGGTLLALLAGGLTVGMLASRWLHPFGRLSAQVREALEGTRQRLDTVDIPEFALLVHAFNESWARHRDSEKQLRQVIETMPVLLLAVDYHGHVIVWNREAERLTGYTADEITASPALVGRVFGFDRSGLQALFGEFRDRETNLLCQDGRTVTVSWSNIAKAHPVPGWASWVIGQDVTARKQALQQRLLQEELANAQRVHRAMLPRGLPEHPHVAFGVLYQAAWNIGGDIYDVVRLGDRLLFYLADVSGHGLDGAMVAVTIKNTITDYLAIHASDSADLQELLSFIDQRFQRERFPMDYFICLCIGIIDAGQLSMRYHAMGFQKPFMMISPTHEIIELAAGGLPLSAAIAPEHMDFTPRYRRLAAGSSLLLMTDGIYEAEHNGVTYEQRLDELFAEYGHLPPQALCERIRSDLDTFLEGGILQDDITLLAARLSTGLELRRSMDLPGSYQAIDGCIDQLQTFFGQMWSYGLELAVREVITNAIEHGHGGDPHKRLTIAMEKGPGYVQIAVADQGVGFDWRSKLQYRPLDTMTDIQGPISDRGRGLQLSKQAVDALYFNDQGTVATIVRSTQ